MSANQRNYTAILLIPEGGNPSEHYPIEFKGCAHGLGGVEIDVNKSHPTAKILQVMWEDNWQYLPTVIPHDDRFHPHRYRPEQLRKALESCGNLLDDYLRGERRGGSMAWDDLDSTHSILQIDLPEFVRANEESFKIEYPENEDV
ncbi:hypothetical protein [Xanthomonas phage RTH11]|nr:hypothetical protein [Xanthomonas phage RTH11]